MKLLVILTLALLAPAAFAANTVAVQGNIIAVSAMDSDFRIADAITSGHLGAGWKLVSIEFFGGALNDRLIVKNGSDTGPVLMDRYIVDDIKYSTTKYFFGAKLNPLIDFSACTLSAGHKIIFTLDNY